MEKGDGGDKFDAKVTSMNDRSFKNQRTEDVSQFRIFVILFSSGRLFLVERVTGN